MQAIRSGAEDDGQGAKLQFGPVRPTLEPSGQIRASSVQASGVGLGIAVFEKYSRSWARVKFSPYQTPPRNVKNGRVMKRPSARPLERGVMVVK